MIYQICKTEVRLLFYSPIAWIIMMFFAIQSGIVFTNILDEFLGRQEMHYGIWDLSRSIFSNNVLNNAQDYLFLYMPILTMGLIGREVASGSFKLLQSSPVRVSEIILGKYLSMVFISFLLSLIIGAEIVFTSFTIPNFDYSAIFCALMGFFLLACAYSAIGLFMSCLLVNQLLTALGSILVLAFLTFVSNFGQDNLFVKELTYWLSVKNHTDGMRMGVLYSEDLFYFIIIICSFLSFSILSLWFERNSVSLKKKVSYYAAVAFSAIALGILSYQPHLKLTYDFTGLKSNSLKKEFRQILDDIDGDLKITSYVNLLDRKSKGFFPERIIADRNSFDKYIRHKPSTKMEYVFYYNNPKIENDSVLKETARKSAILNRTNFKRYSSRAEIHEIDSLLKSESYSFFRVLENTGNGKKAIVRTYNDIQTQAGEKEIAAAMKRISGIMPKIAFLTGKSNRSIYSKADSGYEYIIKNKYNRSSFENLGFNITDIKLKLEDEIPVDLAALIIADPVNPFKEWEIKKILDYIDRGGNLILLSEYQSILNCNFITNSLGIKFEKKSLFQNNDVFQKSLLTLAVPEEAKKVNEEFKYMTKYNDFVITDGVLSISVTDSSKFKKVALLKTISEKTWSQDLNGIVNKKSNVVAYALNRIIDNKDQRIFVMGDSDFISNGELKSSRRGLSPRNNGFVKNLMFWLSSGELPLDDSRDLGNETYIAYKQESMSVVRLFYIGIVPFLILIVGARTLMRRKKR
ncbi:MAG: Gldg family protein [Marinifilaceae bacterium]|nr:Gldg family protein [Marinifilaceae bacterium]